MKGKEKNIKEENNQEKKDKKSKKKKIIIIIICILLLLLILFLIWWFNRKFDVTFKYNNGESDYVVKVKYQKLIDEKDIKNDLVYSEHSFVGYFETYSLDKETDCKKGFKLNDDKKKCISVDKFDFKNTKIKKNTVIEALWNNITFEIDPTSKTINEGDIFTIKATITGTDDKTVKWSSANSSIAKVDDSGKVTGVKKGDVEITAESNGIKRICKVTVKEVIKDTGKISLGSSKKCIIGSDSVKISANITGNALDKTITWSYPDCYTVKNTSATVKTLTRNGSCADSKNLNPSVTGKLKNGSKASTSFKYEPTLKVTVYNDSKVISPSYSGAYEGNNIKIVTNTNASFSGKYIKSHTSNSATLNSTCQTVITVKTSCGQTKTIAVYAVIH